MTESCKIIVRGGGISVAFEGEGEAGRRYAIRPCGSQYAASLIAGDGQAITATGRTPLYALLRAESVQTPFEQES